MHQEHYVNASETIGDIVIGMSDGLTVTLALAAGLSDAVNASELSSPLARPKLSPVSFQGY